MSWSAADEYLGPVTLPSPSQCILGLTFCPLHIPVYHSGLFITLKYTLNEHWD